MGAAGKLLPSLRDVPSEGRWSFPPRPWTHHVSTIALHPIDAAWLAVGIELGGVIRSRYGGATWIDHNPQAHSDAHSVWVDELVCACISPHSIWRRDGLGRNPRWTRVSPNGGWRVESSGEICRWPGGPSVRSRRSRRASRAAVDDWGDSPELRRMPYALTSLPEQPNTALLGLRGGTLLRSDDAGDSWSRLALELDDVTAL
jgi:photosystem II stability/assembly factor-like uncharacterized protein